MASVTSTGLQCAAALSTLPQAKSALREAVAAARAALDGRPDLALLFLSSQYTQDADQLAAEACDLLGTANVLGCTAESIVGTAREVEEEPALSLWLARWPGVK